MSEGKSYNLTPDIKKDSNPDKERELAHLKEKVSREEYSADLLNEVLNYYPLPENERSGQEYEDRSRILMELEWKYPKVIFDRQAMAHRNLDLLVGSALLKKYKVEVDISKKPYQTEPIPLESAINTLGVISGHGEHFKNYRFGQLDTFINRSLHVLERELNEKDAIDIAISFISNVGGYLFRDVHHGLADVLNRDAAYASSKLLPLLKNENPNLKTLSGELLYRLEFENIGISKEGVRYLNKLYDLETLNSPDYFAQRLTAKGDVGVFDNGRVLKKYFNLGDLSDGNQLIKPQVMDFAYETLFFSKENETEEEKEQREKYLEEFKTNYFGFYNDDFFKKTKIRFNNLNFREQGWFLMYYKHADEAKRQELTSFVKEFGEDGLKSFLSLERGEDLGDKILAIGNNLEPWQARLVFGKIAEMVDIANEEEKEFQKLLTEEDKVDLFGIQLKLLEKSHEIIFKFSEADKKDVLKLLQDLEESKIQIDLLSVLLKTAKENGIKLSPENIKDMKIEKKEVGELLGEEKEKFLEKYEKEILAMVEDNYSKVFAENPEAREKVTRNFGERLSNLEKYRVHMLTFQGELVAVMTMQPIEGTKDEVMAESFIVHPDAQHYSLGIAFARVIMKQESAKNTVHGKVRADNAAIIKTHENWGFIFDREHPFFEEKVEYLKMRLEKGGFREVSN